MLSTHDLSWDTAIRIGLTSQTDEIAIQSHDLCCARLQMLALFGID